VFVGLFALATLCLLTDYWVQLEHWLVLVTLGRLGLGALGVLGGLGIRTLGGLIGFGLGRKVILDTATTSCSPFRMMFVGQHL
jgi:hypothetical protein